jgi:hypothetical protein
MMTPKTAGVEPGGTEAHSPAQEIDQLRDRVRHLKARLARYEPQGAQPLDTRPDGPQRQLSPEEIQTAVHRLLGVCAEQGVGAVLPEVCTCRELLVALADACHRSGMTATGQYLDYLSNPYD